jgi:hypothetical protein
MKIYEIDGKQYAVIGEELYERLGEATTGAVPTAPIEDNGRESPPPLPRRKHPLTKAKKQVRKYIPKKGYKRGTCGKCGEEGHSAWHCPEREQKKEVSSGSPAREAAKQRLIEKARKLNRCGNCGKPGHKATTCPDKKAPALTEDQIEYIREQSEAGVSVEKIAMDTGLDEAIVKKYW